MSVALAASPEFVDENDIAGRARSFVPMLRARQAETDRLGKTPDETVNALQAAGLYSMAAPQAYGGLETSVTTWMKAVIELARGDGGVAWAVTLINSCAWLAAGFFPRPVVEEIFAKPNARVAAVLASRKMQARRVKGGIIVEHGIWVFNSGVYHAQWDLLGVPVLNDAGEFVEPGVAAVPMSDVKILHDWDTIGLRGSGSSSVALENVFIPDERIVSMPKMMAGEQKSIFHDSYLYRSAFMPVMAVIITFPTLGLGMHMLEAVLETLPSRNIPYTAYAKQGEAPVTHLQIGEASAKIDCAKLLIERACAEIDTLAEKGEAMSYMDRARIRRDSGAADKLIWEAVDLLASAGGGSFARRTNIMNRIWEDARVANMHGIIAPASNFELYGRLLCGMDANQMFV